MFKYGIKSLLISEKKFEAKNPHRFEKRQTEKLCLRGSKD
jgi:hypothetical protein